MKTKKDKLIEELCELVVSSHSQLIELYASVDAILNIMKVFYDTTVGELDEEPNGFAVMYKEVRANVIDSQSYKKLFDTMKMMESKYIKKEDGFTATPDEVLEALDQILEKETKTDETEL